MNDTFYQTQEVYTQLLKEELDSNFRVAVADELIKLVNDYDSKNKTIKKDMKSRLETIKTDPEQNTQIDVLNAIVDTILYLTNKAKAKKNEKEELSGNIEQLTTAIDIIVPTPDDIEFKDEYIEPTEQYNKIEEGFKYIQNIIVQESINVHKSEILLNENVTYYDIRMLLTQLYKYVNNSILKGYLMELAKAVGKLELAGIPLSQRAQLTKLRAMSPDVFK